MTKKADDLAHVDMKTCSLVVGEGVTSLEAEMVFFNYYYVRFTTVVAILYFPVSVHYSIFLALWSAHP